MNGRCCVSRKKICQQCLANRPVNATEVGTLVSRPNGINKQADAPQKWYGSALTTGSDCFSGICRLHGQCRQTKSEGDISSETGVIVQWTERESYDEPSFDAWFCIVYGHACLSLSFFAKRSDTGSMSTLIAVLSTRSETTSRNGVESGCACPLTPDTMNTQDVYRSSFARILDEKN